MTSAGVCEHRAAQVIEQDETLASFGQNGIVESLRTNERFGCLTVGGAAEVAGQDIADQGGHREQGRDDQRESRKLLPILLGDLVEQHATGDQADNGTVGIVNGCDGAYRGAQLTGFGFGIGLAGERVGTIPQILVPHVLGNRVGEADPVGGHERDEVDVGFVLDPMGVGLQTIGGVRGGQALAHERVLSHHGRGRSGHRLRSHGDPRAGLLNHDQGHDHGNDDHQSELQGQEPFGE